MSTVPAKAAAPARNLYFVSCLDRAEPASVEKRATLLQEHLQFWKPLIESGFFKLGGGLLSPESDPALNTDENKMIGSVAIVEAESLQAVRDKLSEDVYYKQIWDLEKLIVLPFHSAKPLP